MQLIPKEDLERAREMDLFTYLTYYDPGNLKHVSGNTYCTVEHDSLIINNGKWCWFSQGIGGRSALDYLIKVKGIPFREAVDRIIGNVSEPLPIVTQATIPPKVFIMPEVSSDTSNVQKYLEGRGIDKSILKWCFEHKLIFQTAKYGDVLFIGYDTEGTPKYGAVRSTTRDYKGDIKGSDKRFAFRIVKAKSPRKVHVFESAPDLLAYATYIKLSGKNWRKESYLSLGGIGGSQLPKALEQFLNDYPDISDILLHLDNDAPGRNAVKSIKEQLKDSYRVRDYPPPSGKDFNDFLLNKLSQLKNKEAIVR